MEQMSNSNPLSKLNFANVIEESVSSFSTFLPLNCQFRVLSCIPNFHRWLLSRDLRRNDYLIDQGLSPRSIILRLILFEEEVSVAGAKLCFNDTGCVLKLILTEVYKVSVPDLHKFVKRGRVIRKEPKAKISITDLQDMFQSGNDIIQPSIPMQSSLYKDYRSEIVMNGTLLWRLRSPLKDIFVLNGYNSVNGAFQVSSL